MSVECNISPSFIVFIAKCKRHLAVGFFLAGNYTMITVQKTETRFMCQKAITIREKKDTRTLKTQSSSRLNYLFIDMEMRIIHKSIRNNDCYNAMRIAKL